MIFFIVGLLLAFLCVWIPGMHPNTIAEIVGTIGHEPFSAEMLIVLVSAFVVFQWLSATLFSFPDTGLVVSTFSHSYEHETRNALLLEILTTILLSVCLTLALFPLALFVTQPLFQSIKPLFFPLLCFSLFTLAWGESIAGISIMLLAALYGTLTFSSGISYPLVAMFSGLFALPAVMWEEKREDERREPIENTLRFLLALFGVLSAYVGSLVPAIGSPMVLVALFAPLQTMKREYLLPVGVSIVTSSVLWSFLTLHTIDIARLGIVSIIHTLTPVFLLSDVIRAIGISLITIGTAVLVVLMLHPWISFQNQSKLLRGTVFLFLFAVTVFLCGWKGVIFLATGTVLGMLPLVLNVKRTTLMTSIIFPTILLVIPS